GLLQPIPAPAERSAWLATGFSVAPVAPHYLSGVVCLDSRLARIVELRMPAIEWERLPIAADQRRALRRLLDPLPPSPAAMPLLVFTGRAGSGREATAEAVCGELGVPFLRVDLELLRASGENMTRLAQALRLQQRLQGAGLFLAPGEALLDKEGKPLPEAQHFIRALTPAKSPIFIACEPGALWREALSGQRAVFFHFDAPDYAARLKL